VMRERKRCFSSIVDFLIFAVCCNVFLKCFFFEGPSAEM
jgi:hypothetical protein